MMNYEKGDYVLATKYNDGDPRDHFCVGFYDCAIKYPGSVRYHIAEGNGKRFRHNGFRRIEKISREVGQYILDNLDRIEISDRSVWWWLNRAKLKNMEIDDRAVAHEALIKLGMTEVEILATSAVDEVIRLSEHSGVDDIAYCALVLIGSIRLWTCYQKNEINEKSLSEATNTLASATRAFSVTLDELFEILKVVAPRVRLCGMDLLDTTTIIAMLRNRGFQPTSIARVLCGMAELLGKEMQ